MWNLCYRIYLPEFNAKNRIEIDAKITELRRFKVAIFTCFEKSNQEKIELGDNEASAEVTSRGQQEENFHTKLYKINSILQPKWLI